MTHRSTLRTFVAAVVVLVPQWLIAQTPPTPPAPPSTPAAPAAPAEPAAPPPPPSKVYIDGVVKIGDTRKQTRGRVTDVDKGDNGCWVTFRDDKNNEFVELGKFSLCTQKPPFKGKKVELTYAMETIQAADCYGDPKCKKTETVPLITVVNVAD